MTKKKGIEVCLEHFVVKRALLFDPDSLVELRAE